MVYSTIQYITIIGTNNITQTQYQSIIKTLYNYNPIHIQ